MFRRCRATLGMIIVEREFPGVGSSVFLIHIGPIQSVGSGRQCHICITGGSLHLTMNHVHMSITADPSPFSQVDLSFEQYLQNTTFAGGDLDFAPLDVKLWSAAHMHAGF